MDTQTSIHVTTLGGYEPACGNFAATIAGIESDDLEILAAPSMHQLTRVPQAIPEPHWHPDTAEMGYVADGRGRMTVLDPDGRTDSYLIGPGDIYFIPPAYPHHIESIGADTLHILIFFNRAPPRDIGYRAAGHSPHLIAREMQVSEQDLQNFPVDLSDAVIVSRL